MQLQKSPPLPQHQCCCNPHFKRPTIKTSPKCALRIFISLPRNGQPRSAEKFRAATSNDVFPDFSGLSARALGFVRQERLPIHEPSILPKQAAVSDLEHNVEQYNCDSNKDVSVFRVTAVSNSAILFYLLSIRRTTAVSCMLLSST